MDQLGPLVWAVFGGLIAGQTSIWLVTWGICVYPSSESELSGDETAQNTNMEHKCDVAFFRRTDMDVYAL